MPVPNEWKDFHKFPNGFEISFESDLEGELNYTQQLMKLIEKGNINNLLVHIDRWKYLCPELRNSLYPLPLLQYLEFFFESEDYQKYLIGQSKIPTEDFRTKTWQKLSMNILNICLPPTLLRYSMISDHFMVPLGLAILQSWNVNRVDEIDGYWYLKRTR